jgi:guanylate kinase
MSRLIIFAGASGAGKSYILKLSATEDKRLFVPIKKLTTRSPRPYEKESIEQNKYIDLSFNHSEEEVTDCFFHYKYANEHYGVDKVKIDKILGAGQYPLLIIRSSVTVEKIKQHYTNCFAIYVQGFLSGRVLAEKLKAQGRKDIDIEQRMKRIAIDHDDYMNYIDHDIYDKFIINDYDDRSVEKQLHKLLSVKYLEEGVSSFDKNLIFVIMPFKEEYDFFFDMTDAAAGKLNKELNVVRVDKKGGSFPVAKEIFKSIENARLIVCEATEISANVYMELGYAMRAGKDIILCAKKDVKLPYNITGMQSVRYKDIQDLYNQMKRQFELLL